MINLFRNVGLSPFVLSVGIVTVTILASGVDVPHGHAIETFRIYAMGENDPGAVIGGSNPETLDSLDNPDDIGGALVHLDNLDGAKYVEGRTGPGSFAIEFNAAEELSSVEFDPRNGTGASFTAFSQAWLKPDSASAGTRQTIWQLGPDLGTLVINEQNNWEMVINGGGGGPGFIATDTPVAFDDWAHVALLRTGGSGRIYVNGTIVGSTSNFWNGPGLAVSVGTSNDLTEFYDGVIDDFNIGSAADGSFDVAVDVDFWNDTVFSGVLGDVDPSQDGLVNDLDYQTWSANVGFDNQFGNGDPGTLVRGDVDQNGRVNYFDFQIIFEQAALAGVVLTGTGVVVPEPSSLFLILATLTLVCTPRLRLRSLYWSAVLPLAAWVAMTFFLASGTAHAEVVVAEDFFYQQPTKPFGTNIGFAFQSFGGGENGAAGNWDGRWTAIGDATITGADHPEASEQFMGFTSDVFDAAGLVRSYQLSDLASNQTLYFSAQILDSGSIDSGARFVLNVPDGGAETEVSFGYEAGTFAAVLGNNMTLGSANTFDLVSHQLVGKFEINAAGPNERLSVWIDPTGIETGPEVVTVESDVITGLDDDAFTGDLSLQISVGSFGSRIAWWDNIAIGTTWDDVATVDLPRLTLQVNTTTGNANLLNKSGVDFDLNFIEILSESGALDDSRWNSLDSQGTDGGAWQENNPSATALTETNFGGATTLVDGSQFNLGQVFDTSGNQDIVARFGTDLGLLNITQIEYVAGTPGDFDEDGDVDGGDFLKWQRETPNLGASDLVDWQNNFGTGALVSSAATAVPEPATLLLLSVVSLCGGVVRSRRNNSPE